MALLLHTVRQNRWLRDEARYWLDNGDVPADALSDLRTSQHRLSVWEVLPDHSNLERIVRALAVTKDKIAATGYVLFDSEWLPAIQIAVSRDQPGTTPDKGANDWHRDLIDLSGNKLVALTKTILERGESGAVLKKRLCELVEAGIQDKQLPERCRSVLG